MELIFTLCTLFKVKNCPLEYEKCVVRNRAHYSSIQEAEEVCKEAFEFWMNYNIKRGLER